MTVQVPYDILGLILGLLGISGLIPLIWKAICHQLPRHRLKQLDATLEETSSLLESVIEDGLFPNIAFVVRSREGLHGLRNVTESLRASVLCAEGFRLQVVAALQGLSSKVNDVRQDVNELRLRIAKVSDSERRKVATAVHRGLPYSAAATSDMHPRSFFNSKQHKLGDDAFSGHDSDNHDLTKSIQAMETSSSMLPEIATPPPSYTAYARTIQHQAVRYNSGFANSHNRVVTLNCGEMMSSSLASPGATIVLHAKDAHTAQVSPGFTTCIPLNTGSCSPHPVGDEQTIFPPNRITSASVAHYSIVDHATGRLSIADLEEQIVDELQQEITSSIRNTLKRVVRGTSRLRANPGDLETAVLLG